MVFSPLTHTRMYRTMGDCATPRPSIVFFYAYTWVCVCVCVGRGREYSWPNGWIIYVRTVLVCCILCGLGEVYFRYFGIKDENSHNSKFTENVHLLLNGEWIIVFPLSREKKNSLLSNKLSLGLPGENMSTKAHHFKWKVLAMLNVLQRKCFNVDFKYEFQHGWLTKIWELTLPGVHPWKMTCLWPNLRIKGILKCVYLLYSHSWFFCHRNVWFIYCRLFEFADFRPSFNIVILNWFKELISGVF